MKVVLEKNLAFSDQTPPILAKDLLRLVKPREAISPLEEVQIDVRKILPTVGSPRIEAGFDEQFNPTLKVWNFRLGEHIFPPNIEAIGIESLGAKSQSFSEALISDPFLPDHLALQPLPTTLPQELQTPPFFVDYVFTREVKKGNQATTVFPPENRRVFSDTSYPWGTCGRVDSPLGQGSGVMVGPRHLLTCSHIVQWNSDGSAGWIRFRPGYFAPSEPFGDAWATVTYYKYKVTGPTIDWTEGMYDYVVCVLDRRIGNWTGWMGSKGYTDSWDGGAYWSHIGYPGDLTGGNRPTFQGGIALDGEFWQPDSHEAMSHRGDVWPGQSGGPFFGWWSSSPYTVAVQSSQNSSENNASGGQDMVDLILKARNDYP